MRSSQIKELREIVIPFFVSAADPFNAPRIPTLPHSSIPIKAWEEKPQGATSDFGTSRHEPIGILAGNSWISPIKLSCRNKGRWKTLFVMTVAIDPESPSDASQFRVFSFDPETQVGTGAIPAK